MAVVMASFRCFSLARQDFRRPPAVSVLHGGMAVFIAAKVRLFSYKTDQARPRAPKPVSTQTTPYPARFFPTQPLANQPYLTLRNPT